MVHLMQLLHALCYLGTLSSHFNFNHLNLCCHFQELHEMFTDMAILVQSQVTFFQISLTNWFIRVPSCFDLMSKFSENI